MQTKILRFFAAASVLLALFALCSPNIARAQAAVSADILGTVTDQSGAVIPGAQITVKNVGTGIVTTAKSDGKGEYLVQYLQVGTYKLTVEAKGFKTFIATGLTLAAGDRARVEPKLQVGTEVETVEVQGGAPALQTDSSDISTLVTTTAVADMPLNGRNYTNLVTLTAGVTEGAANAVSSGNVARDRRMTSAFSANGQYDMYNNQMVDGMDNNERAIGTQVIKPSIDAVDQVVVLTNLYPAEYSRTIGGMINVITKSGTNGFHGTLFEFLRNDKLNAATFRCSNYCGVDANPFTTTLKKGELRQNQYGGSIGGPIKKEKTFFFGDFEGFRQISGLAIAYATVPSAATQTAVANAAVGSTLSITDPLTPGSPTETATVSQIGKNLMALYPSPNQNSTGAAGPNNFAYSPRRVQYQKTLDTRIDQHFSAKDMLFGRYSWDQTWTGTPPGLPPETVNGQAYYSLAPENQHEQAVATDWVHIFSPTLLLELKAGYTSFKNLGNGFDQLGAATNLGFAACPAINANNTTSATAFCINNPYGGAQWGVPSVSPAGYAGLGDAGNTEVVLVDGTYQYAGSLTWNRGNHSVKVGVGLMRRHMSQMKSLNALGGFTENGYYSGDGLVDMIDGYATSATQQPVMNYPAFRSWEPGGYIQDSWRALQWLTVNLGVRYDFFSPFTDKHGAISNFNQTLGVLQSPALLGLYQGTNTGDVLPDYSNIQPRLGFSASLKHQIVVRGGLGFTAFSNEIGPGTDTQMGNPPFVFTATYGDSNGSFYPVPYQMQIPAAQALGTIAAPAPCSATTYTVNCMLNLTAGLEEPFVNPATAGPTFLQGGGHELDGVENHLHSGRLAQYSLGIEKEFGANVVVLEYVGNQGRHLPLVPIVNQAPYATPYTKAGSAVTCSSASVANYKACGFLQAGDLYNPNPVTVYGNPAYPTTPTGQTGGTPTTADGQNLWGDPIYMTESDSNSLYNSMILTFTRRLSKGLSTNLNYTWAHAESDGAPQGEGNNRTLECVTPGCIEDLGNGSTRTITKPRSYDRSASDLDIQSRIDGTISYQLPFFKSANGVLGEAAKGWIVNAMGLYQTSVPEEIVEAGGGSGMGNVSGIANWRGNDSPNQIANPNISNKSPKAWFNVNAFAPQQIGTLGNVHRNSIFGPHQRHMDFSIDKEFALPEAMRLQFRAEAFNLTNTVNLGMPGANYNLVEPATSTFGVITGTGAGYNPRLVQFALKLAF